MSLEAVPRVPVPPSKPVSASAGPFGPEVRRLAVAFAATCFVVSSVVWGVLGVDPVASALGKLIGLAGDMVLAAFVTLVLWRMRGYGLGAKALTGCFLSLGLSPLSALADWGLHIYFVHPVPVPFDHTTFGQVVIFTTSELFGWSCLYLAYQYNGEVREAERRMVAVRQAALAAQMRALHYQVNPHFLFNTLNSVAGLIEEDEKAPAAEMVLALAAFLRQTLALEPETDVTLGEELDLQLHYLGIESIRFSDRLDIRVEVDPALHGLKVPPLILQPLVENAVKHGVARHPGRALLVIGAAEDPAGMLHGWVEDHPAGTLRLWVENGMPPLPGAHPGGLGIGLENVSRRLAARWPGVASCETTFVAPNRHRAVIRIPALR